MTGAEAEPGGSQGWGRAGAGAEPGAAQTEPVLPWPPGLIQGDSNTSTWSAANAPQRRQRPAPALPSALPWEPAGCGQDRHGLGARDQQPRGRSPPGPGATSGPF